MNSSKWFPSWCEFREALITGDSPSVEEAWGIACMAHINTSREMPVDLGDFPDIRQAVHTAGGSSALRSGDFFVKKTFESVYLKLLNARRDRTDEELKTEAKLALMPASQKLIESGGS